MNAGAAESSSRLGVRRNQAPLTGQLWNFLLAESGGG